MLWYTVATAEAKPETQRGANASFRHCNLEHKAQGSRRPVRFSVALLRQRVLSPQILYMWIRWSSQEREKERERRRGRKRRETLSAAVDVCFLSLVSVSSLAALSSFPTLLRYLQ